MLVWNGSATRRRTASSGGGDRTGGLRALPLLVLVLAPALGAETGAPRDPRIPLVERQAESDPAAALRAVEKALNEDPAAARRLGLEYLHGDLLLRLGRRQEALEAFAATLGGAPELAAFSRYRLAVEQQAAGHPEVAAGLLATLLGSSPPRSLVAPAVRLLVRSLAEGGDCALLTGLSAGRWQAPERRRLLLAKARCAARRGDAKGAERRYFELLEENRQDEVARLAADSLVAFWEGKRDARSHLLLGLAFYNHREFRQAIHHLARALVQLPAATDITPRESFECRYALARSHFWLGRYDSAAVAFDALAGGNPGPERRAQVLYQKARSRELAGDWEAASAAFLAAYEAEPRGRRWAAAALVSRLRLEWLGGDEDEALAAYRQLTAAGRLGTASRALLFLASSELVQGRGERAEEWLATVARLGRVEEQETLYWRGRAQEARGRHEEAAASYARLLAGAPHHPLAGAARGRLAGPALAPWGERISRRLAASARAEELYAAWLLLGDSEPRGRQVRGVLAERLAADPAAAPFLALVPAPARTWPLWQTGLDRPEEMLLALGLFAEGAAVVLHHFPVAEPPLAFTASLALAHSGEVRQSLLIAEILARRIPGQVPAELLPVSYRRLLYPLSYRRLIIEEAAKRGVDPHLLAAIIREESRFDPRAFSSAAARGLTQFIFSTAERVAATIELGPISPHDLEDPAIAIALGAAYLGELVEEFGGAVHQAVAAYNAGEPQADLWRRYCYSDEPEEYLTKVAFGQTRAYLTKVLTSRRHYAELYPAVGSPLRESVP